MSRELAQLNYIDRFSAQSVMGRTLGYLEIQHMVLAENVVNAYNSRISSDDFVRWNKDNKDGARLLEEALLAALDLGYING